MEKCGISTVPADTVWIFPFPSEKNHVIVRSPVSPCQPETDKKGTQTRALSLYSMGIQVNSRISPVFSFFTMSQLATFTRD